MELMSRAPLGADEPTMGAVDLQKVDVEHVPRLL